MIRTILFLLVSLFMQSAALAFGDGQIKSVWLTSSLYGNDNKVAALSKVKIYKGREDYRIYVRNQFGFDCKISFDSAGNPANLSYCSSRQKPSPVCNPRMPNSQCAIASNCFRKPNETNPACFYRWKVVESIVPFKCVKTRKEQICKGRYTLSDTRGYSSHAEFTIARRLQ